MENNNEDLGIHSKSFKHRLTAHSLGTKILIGFGACLIIAIVVIGILYKNNLFSASKTPDDLAVDSIASSAKCSLPETVVKEHAFTIGVPDGWIYELNNGTVSIMKDKSNLEGAFLYTAKLTKKDMTAKEFLTTSSGFFTKSVAEDGGTFNVIDIKETDGNAEGTIEASMTETPITGSYKVKKEGDFITLLAYYSPKTDIDKSRDNLEQVVGCFSRTTTLNDEILTAVKASEDLKKATPSGFSKYAGKYFSLSLPGDYKVTGESDSGIDISRNDDSAGFSYAYVTGAKGPYTAESWTNYALPTFAKIGSLSLGAGKNVQSKVPGMKVQDFSFTGVLNSTTNVTGKVTTGVINTTDLGAGSSTSAFWAIQIAKPNVWNNVSSTLQIIQDSITIIDIGDVRKKAMVPPNRPTSSTSSSSPTSSSSGSSVSDESSDAWADAMHGYETVESPTTGDHFDVPLNSWNETGVDGPGYYNGGEKLTPAEY